MYLLRPLIPLRRPFFSFFLSLALALSHSSPPPSFSFTLPLSKTPSSIEHVPSISQRQAAGGRVGKRDHFASGLKSLPRPEHCPRYIKPGRRPVRRMQGPSPTLLSPDLSYSLANPRPSTLIQLGAIIACSTPFLCRPGSACGPAPPSPPCPACLPCLISVSPLLLTAPLSNSLPASESAQKRQTPTATITCTRIGQRVIRHCH
ncbi:hypothetical protein LZ30DRAFT_138781 [Colletotrichum cereale]|nr:hypothetical protein LZ30DRAFT_138781 [Colletotrichum cereale]